MIDLDLDLNVAQCNAQRISTDKKILELHTMCQIEDISIINFQEINIYQVKSIFERKGWIVHINALFENVFPEMLTVWQGRSISGSDDISVQCS